MMKKVIFTLSLAGLCTSAAWAQRLDPCSTDQMHQKQVEAHPELLEMEANLNKAIAEKMARNEMSAFARTTDDDGTAVYHVPLVFHVIHDFGAEYVTDNDIRNCVKRMNALYNKQNSDTIDVISPFKSFIHNSSTRYIGNARIQWHLATKDPNGNATSGITRRRTYLTNSGSDFAKYDQWPNENYMNIWLINAMSAANKKAAAYAYKPPTASLIPYYDGPIGMAQYIHEADYTFSHELGHELNLDHTWGGTNDPTIACGDDDVQDTPITKGHDPANACGDFNDIYDTACLYKRNLPIAKTRPDSFRRADTGVLLLFSDNSTTKGIIFKNRTTSRIDSLSFYPTDTVGSTYKIGVSRNGVLFDSVTVVTTVKNAEQRIACNFKVPAADTSVNFKMAFLVNPGALRDTLHPSVRFSTGINGSIDLRTVQTDNFYNFFYSWKITYGNFQIYPNDSLVDYPDTTNSQNVMDYTYCAKMFTAGQVERMRTALTLTGPSSANRGNLITTENLKKTGVYDASGNVITTAPELKPEAELFVDKGVSSASTLSDGRLYFMCAESAAQYSYIFQNKSWQATPISVNWTLSNGATVPTSTSTDKVTTKFANPGWATVTLVATNAQGSDTATERVFVADPATMDPVGYFQEFNDKAEIDSKWPMFNYYNNQYKWELSDRGYYDNTSMRYKSYDVRTFPATLVGDPSGDYDDFFTPAFDLSKLGTNGNLNFMYAGAYATNDYSLMKDVLEISYSTTCGGIWTPLTSMANEELQTVGTVPMGMEYLSVYKDWKPKSINLKTGTADIRNTRVFFRFRYKPSSRMIGGAMYASGNNFYIDRIHISNNPLSVNEMILVDKQATLAPNPTNSNAFVLFGKPNANVHISVTDVTGKLIYTVSTAIDQNNAKVEIPASALGVKGFYMVHITGDDNLNQTEKLVVY